jgi:hypothetical protein
MSVITKPRVKKSCDLPTRPLDPQSRATSTKQEGGLSDIQLVSASHSQRNGEVITIRVNEMAGRSKREGTLGTHLVRPLFFSLVIYKKLQKRP